MHKVATLLLFLENDCPARTHKWPPEAAIKATGVADSLACLVSENMTKHKRPANVGKQSACLCEGRLHERPLWYVFAKNSNPSFAWELADRRSGKWLRVQSLCSPPNLAASQPCSGASHTKYIPTKPLSFISTDSDSLSIMVATMTVVGLPLADRIADSAAAATYSVTRSNSADKFNSS